jgi:hypothetical protein
LDTEKRDKKNCPAHIAEGSLNIQFLGVNGLDNHIFEQDLQRHRVTAALVGDEKFAVAIKNTFIVTNVMLTIIAVEIKVKLIKEETMSVLCVTFCLFYFSNQSRIHCMYLLFWGL